MPRGTIRVAAIAAALTGQRLGRGRYVNGTLCCGVGKLAVVAGFPLVSLKMIDTNQRRIPHAGYMDWWNACLALDAVMLSAYGLTTNERLYLNEANDEEHDAARRSAAVIRMARHLNSGEIDIARDEIRRIAAAENARHKVYEDGRESTSVRALVRKGALSES